MDITKKGIGMVAGANEALVYRKAHPRSSDEEVMKHVMHSLNGKQFKNSQMEIVVGVSHALKLIARNPSISDKAVISQIVNELSTLLPN